MKLVIQIPCFNEEESLPVTISALPKQIAGIDEIEILVIDDGSTDKTSEVAYSLGVNRVEKMPVHKGLARAFIVGLSAALDMGADIVVNTDADNQYCAEDIEKLISPVINGTADIVIGARPVASIKEFSLLKRGLQKLGSAVMRILSSTSVKDAPSGFRAFSRQAAIQLNVFDNYTYTLETIIQARAKGLTVESVDINVNPSIRRSRLFSNIFSYVTKSTFTMLRMFIVYRPFRFFIILSLIALLIGLLISLRFVWFYMAGMGKGHIQSLIFAAVFLISGVQIGLIAILAELISINRKLLEDIQQRIKTHELQNNSDSLK